jgi:hypothetical protein
LVHFHSSNDNDDERRRKKLGVIHRRFSADHSTNSLGSFPRHYQPPIQPLLFFRFFFLFFFLLL